MKILAFLKLTAVGGNDLGDIISFHRLTNKPAEVGLDALNYFLPVVVDINIPCGEKYDVPPNNCAKCLNNHPEDCDVIKYTRGTWSAGDLENPPRLLYKRKHRIAWDNLSTINGPLKTRLLKNPKTLAEMTAILTDLQKANMAINIATNLIVKG